MSWRLLKYYCAGPPQYGLNIGADTYIDKGVRLLRTTDIREDGSLTPSSEGVYVPDAAVGPTYTLQANDVLFSRAGSLGRCLRVPEHRSKMTFAGYLVRFQLLPGVDPRYIEYCASAKFFQANIEAEAVTSTISNLNAERYGNLPLPDKNKSDQSAIADFLDIETARIDVLVAKKRCMIALLGERRQGAIDDTMSGIEERISLRYAVSRLTSGPRGWSDRTGQEGSPFFRITNINRTDVELDRRELLRVEDPGTAEGRRTRVCRGDVLVSITADIGSVAVARAVDDGAFISQHIALLTPARCEGEWLAYAIKSTKIQQDLNACQYGGTKTQLSLSDIAALCIPITSASNRRHRLRSLVHKLTSIGSAQSALERQIDLLRERRQALITAAVTGNMKVPGVAT